MKNIVFWQKLHKARCILGLILSIVITACSYFGILWASTIPSEVSPGGLDIFKQFTVCSNLLVMIPTLLTVSYQIDGLFHNSYHLPKWLAYLQYSATVCVVETFLVSAFFGSQTMGLMDALWHQSNRYLHLIVPTLALLLFIFQNFEVKLRPRYVFAAIVPVMIYSAVYLILSVFIGKHNGGWADFYQVTTAFPWYVSLCIAVLLPVCIAFLLLLAHNAWARVMEKAIRRSIAQNESRSIEEAIAHLAMQDHMGKGGEDTLVLPLDVLAIMKKRYQSALSLQELSKLYIEDYIK